MADNSKIEWTDATWPVVQGCDYESPGCTHCYAVPLLWRMSHHPDPKISGPLNGVVEKRDKGKLVFTGKVALREDRLDWPLKWKTPKKIFLPSHGDLFHAAVPDEFIDRVFAVMALAPHHTFQVLTKRAQRMRDYCLGASDADRRVWDAANREDLPEGYFLWALGQQGGAWGGDRPWPLRNVWLGVSVEDQIRADERIPPLLDTPASKRFISAEPLLGPVDLTGITTFISATDEPLSIGSALSPDNEWDREPKLDWVIVGGESGPSSRAFNIGWARALVEQCRAASVACFVKQLGAMPIADRQPQFHEALGRDYRIYLKDRKGGDIGEWPMGIRVREFPDSHSPDGGDDGTARAHR